MLAISELLDAFCSDVFLSLATLAVAATAILCLALVATCFLRRQSAAVRYCVWQFAIVGLLVLPFLAAVLPAWSIRIPLTLLPPRSESNVAPPIAVEARHFVSDDGTRAHAREDLADIALLAQRDMAAAESERITDMDKPRSAVTLPESNGRRGTVEPTVISAIATSWPTSAVAIWSIGVLANLAWMTICVLRAARLSRMGTLVDEPRFLATLNNLQRTEAKHTTVRLRMSAHVRVPVVIGVWRPQILLPVEYMEWSDDRLRVVLSHELAHVERRDIFWQLVSRVSASLYWLHPLVWLAVRRMKVERERACDDYVLRLGVEAVDYAADLVEVAAALAGKHVRLLGSIGMAERSELGSRLEALLDSTTSRIPASMRTRSVLMVGILCVVGIVATVRPFTPTADVRAEEKVAVPAPLGGAEAGLSEPAVSSKSESANVDPAPESSDNKSAAAKTLRANRPESVPTKGSMRIRVVGPNGKPLAGTKIHASVWTNEEEFKSNQGYLCDVEGQVEVKLPKTIEIIRLWARHDSYVPMFVQWSPKEEEDGHLIPEEFTFHLQEGTVMGGLVKDEDGNPIQGVRVEVEYDANGIQEGPKQRAVFNRWLAEEEGAPVTDAEGRWRLDNVPAGDAVKVNVKCTHTDFISLRSSYDMGSEKPFKTQELRQQTATRVMHRGIRLTGTVTDPDGKPVKDALVIWGDRPYREHRPQQEVLTDKDGNYKFPPLPAGTMRVTVVAKAWRPETQKFEITPGIAPLDFQLKSGKELRIRFIDDAGKPIPHVYVRIDQWRGAESLYNVKHSNVLPSKIPLNANNQGVYSWTWAPEDEVTYNISAVGDYSNPDVKLTANNQEHVVTLHSTLHLTGRVTDAQTGRPIERFIAVPVLEFNPDLFHVERDEEKEFSGGQYTLDELDRSDNAYRVRVEAIGYRTAMSTAFRLGDPKPVYDFQLESAPSAHGRILEETGVPVPHVKVFLGTKTQGLDIAQNKESNSNENLRTTTNDRGEFAFPAQFERYVVMAVHKNGYAEATRTPDQIPGDLVLKKWARVEGQLLQAGTPVEGSRIRIDTLRPRLAGSPYIDQQFYATSDATGRFAFEQVPPIRCSVSADLSPWRDYPINSSEHVPLDLQSGQHVVLNLGGNGAQVKGQVFLKGEGAREIDLNYSLNWMLRKTPGIAPPSEIAGKGFDWQRGWSDAWASTEEGGIYRQTLHHYFVKLNRDGTFLISGVPAGDYELAFKIYERPEGCLVNPVAAKVVKFQVTEQNVSQNVLNLGTVEIDAAFGPKPGDMVPDFEFETLDGSKKRLSELRGQHVLLDLWATWCGPCVASLPVVQTIQDKFGNNGKLTIVGLNLDADAAAARQFVRRGNLPWLHGFLGDAATVPTKLGISSVPAYLLIGPDGKLLHRSYTAEQAADEINKTLRQP